MQKIEPTVQEGQVALTLMNFQYARIIFFLIINLKAFGDIKLYRILKIILIQPN